MQVPEGTQDVPVGKPVLIVADRCVFNCMWHIQVVSCVWQIYVYK